MKKLIIATAIVLTTSALTVIKQDNNTQVTKMTRVTINLDKNVLGTAD